MELPSITRSRKALTILDLVVITALAAIVMAGVRPPVARIAGVLSILLLATGCLIWWLPGLEIRNRWLDGLVALAYLALVLLSFVLYGIVFFFEPTTMTLIMVVQILAMLYLACRG